MHLYIYRNGYASLKDQSKTIDVYKHVNHMASDMLDNLYVGMK